MNLAEKIVSVMGVIFVFTYAYIYFITNSVIAIFFFIATIFLTSEFLSLSDPIEPRVRVSK